ncbi:AzlC family ABC transporter permease [Sinorhizobium alkalisoli]|uniref:Branched-chain amino acid ABC transporter permease n=1 Tax=Sinorhizobium alkalisoli TaxID=1752398 RepID=A0A1E3V3R9_9HYPH|nr:AzlC family ABC transporter permease [Sinorhizobium alkalisoli]MCA1491672.1 AzlC family ABC transporter permease [Ensifer sp. NBAIM29]MCG5479780.1 AzlC family ABC transporter permease [Sinorhizobium alkalisoli]ODR88238.1 branched-chain amino acid ABC transporter permease [Sinorhizobium alkalisoli]QFI67029.1 Branched-chain amino acid transport protein AzlC [Sinorhizobium alkalisoli]
MNRAEFREGLREGFPVIVAASPFGALFGALAIDNGFSIADAVLMSATVYAGASQMVGIELFGNHVQPWLIVLSIFAVNFRHVLYSASLTRHIKHYTPIQKFFAFFLLVDPQYAESERRAERDLPVTFSWYLGFALIIYVLWLVTTVVGAVFGQMIGDPKAIGLDVLLPIYFLGLVLGFRKRDRFLPIVATSAVASIAAMHFVGSPWHVSIGALAGIVLAACLPNSRAERQCDPLEQGN